MNSRFYSVPRASVLTLALLTPTAAFAQMAPAATAAHPHYFTRALGAVTLTNAQKSQIAAITARYRAAHPDSAPHDAKAEEEFHQQISAVLTPAQRASVKAQLAKLRAAGTH